MRGERPSFAAISSATQNVNGTWDTNFKAVWHLNQSPGGTAPQMTDSTSTAANATSGGTPTPATATGLIGSGVSTSGTTGTPKGVVLTHENLVAAVSSATGCGIGKPSATLRPTNRLPGTNACVGMTGHSTTSQSRNNRRH